MSIICPECGGESLDAEFCDLCNAELKPSAPAQVPERCPLLPPGEKLTRRQRRRLARPEAAIVVDAEDGQAWRVHWIGRADFPRWFPLIEERAQCGLEILPACRQIDDSQGLWLAAPCRGQPAQPWWAQREKDPLDELRRLHRFARLLAAMLTELHDHGLVWLNFDPEETEEVPAGADAPCRLCPTNLDLRIFRIGQLTEPAAPARGDSSLTMRTGINPAFAAPEISRGRAELIGPATDVFHLGLFCYCWLARLLPDGFPGAGLASFAYHVPPLRIFAPDLPPGLSALLERTLAVNPRERPPTPAAFLADFGRVIQTIEERWTRKGAGLSWDIGAHTRAGRAKTALTGRNEDAILVKEFAAGTLLAVADGISICDVGNGALASSMTLTVLEKNFAELGELAGEQGQVDFPRLCAHSGQEASQALIAWAVQEGQEAALRAGQSLMGTTLCAGWLADGCLHLANLGDSRAYLVTGAQVEQLTVDGDLSSSLLAEGTPPEEVRNLGTIGRALRDCVGGCQIVEVLPSDVDEPPLDEIGPPPEALTVLAPWSDTLPTLCQIPLMPGDVFVLCSDGLVDEGVFLDPARLHKLIVDNRELAAADLAVLLADDADVLQRLPSSLEPEGFGDNISCIVVKIMGDLTERKTV